jgi:RNA polymerase sigma-B factor
MPAATFAAPTAPRSRRRRPRDGRAMTREAERQLLIRYHTEGDLRARDELVERLLPLARSLARRYASTDESLDDLVQVASLGLVKAIDRFDPTRGTRFTSYATPTILGELKRHFRDKGWALRVARDLQERATAVNRQADALSKTLGRSPRPREVANVLGLSVGEVLEASEAMANYEATSLNAPAAREDEESAALVDLLGGEDAGYELVDRRDAIAKAWEGLAEVERRVLELRFTRDLTQREIGERIGCSQMHVSRLLRRALNRLEAATATT